MPFIQGDRVRVLHSCGIDRHIGNKGTVIQDDSGDMELSYPVLVKMDGVDYGTVNPYYTPFTTLELEKVT